MERKRLGEITLGANPVRKGQDAGLSYEFRVWAPKAESLELLLLRSNGEHSIELMLPEGDGYFAVSTRADDGDLYQYRVNGGLAVPDPVSRWLPEGVHGRTRVVDPEWFGWTDAEWRGLPLEQYIIYELHVGA